MFGLRMNKMHSLKIFFIVACILFVDASVNDYLSLTDFNRYGPQLVKTVVGLKPSDIITSYYGVKGFKLFDFDLPLKLYWDVCANIDQNIQADSPVEELYYSVSTYSLSNCSFNIEILKKRDNQSALINSLHGQLPVQDIVKRIKPILDDTKSTPAELRYSLEILTILQQSIPNPTKIAQQLQASLKTDDSLQSYGQVLHAAALLKKDGQFAHQLIEDVVVQADEVDGKMLQWEGGLTTTSLLITGLLRLPGAKPFNQAQADKLAAYLMSRKFIQSPKGIVALFEATKALAESSVSPVCVTFVKSNQVSTEQPNLAIKISNLFGKPIKPSISSVIAQSATRITDDVVVLSKQPLTPSKDPTEFSLALKLDPGTYRIGLTAGSHSSVLIVHVLGPVTLQWLEVGLSDADGSSAPRLNKLEYPSELSTTLQSDATQHLVLRFSLSRPVHQAFLRLSSGNNEIIFVAEQDSSKVYKIDIHLASELSYSSIFDMELILGDFIMSNPLRWSFGKVDLKLPVSKPKTTITKGPKPEIKHLFRPAEKRPPKTVSMLFTGLALAPLLILFGLWFSIGLNIKNLSFVAIPFHLGFGSILGLFVLFWLKLNMFQTCALLIPLGGFTFLAGNRALRNLSKQKTA